MILWRVKLPKVIEWPYDILKILSWWGDEHLFAFCLKYCLLSAPADSQAWNHYVLSQLIQIILQVRYRMNGFCKTISFYMQHTERKPASRRCTKIFRKFTNKNENHNEQVKCSKFSCHWNLYFLGLTALKCWKPFVIQLNFLEVLNFINNFKSDVSVHRNLLM